MKKILLYFATIFVLNIASASQLNLQFSQFARYHVTLNGVYYSVQDNFINISQIGHGNYHLKVVQDIPMGYGICIQNVMYNSYINIPCQSAVYATLYAPYQLQINNVVPFQQQIVINNPYTCITNCPHNHQHYYHSNYYANNGGHYKHHGHHGNGHYQHHGHNGHYNGNNGNHNNVHNGNHKQYENNGNNSHHNNGENGNHNNGNNEHHNNRNNGNHNGNHNTNRGGNNQHTVRR